MQYRVRAYFNQTRHFMPYQAGDPLAPSAVPAATVEASELHEAAELVWVKLNADDRPNGQVECSLSMGDAVAIETPDGVAVLTVASCGFTVQPGLVLDLDAPFRGGTHTPGGLRLARAIEALAAAAPPPAAEGPAPDGPAARAERRRAAVALGRLLR